MAGKTISFPKEHEAVLTSQTYVDFFTTQAALLSDKKEIASSVTLTKGDKIALEGLKTYLADCDTFPSKELTLHLQANAFEGNALQELIILLASKGLESLRLIATEKADNSARALLETVKRHKITLDIELWAGNDLTQKTLDQCTSVYQREKRIETFGHTAQAQHSEADNKKPKRTRKKNAYQNPGIDTEIEVQVDIAAEVAAGVEVEEQFEMKGNEEFIGREKFARKAQAKAFHIKEASYNTLNGHENRTWDRWMGNINQAVVAPARERQRVGIVRDVYNAFEDDAFTCYYKVSGLPNYPSISFVTINKGMFSFSYNESHFYLTDKDISDFINTFCPDFLNGSYKSIELNDEEWEAARPAGYPHLYADFPLYSDSTKDWWKGEHVVDADTLSEDPAALEALKANCPIAFTNPVVSTRLFANPKVGLMTREACEQLLEHQRQLQFGLDFDHLPAGFDVSDVLIEGKWSRVLSYNEKRAQFKRKDPYAIQLNEHETLLPLSHDLFNHWLVNAKDSVIKRHYLELEKTFDRQKIADFKRSLPVMLQLAPADLSKFGTSADGFIQAAIEYGVTLNTIPGTLKSHLLVQLLERDGEQNTLQNLGHWHAKLKLSAADLNRLLAVYNHSGSKGLDAVFSVWNKSCLQLDEKKWDNSLLQSLKTHYFPHCQSFIPLLDPTFERAVIILKNLPKAERHFWDALFEQHMYSVGYDELYPLVKAFQDFTVKIKERNLAFYEPCHFANVKHLQTALARMLAILNNTDERDVPLIWEQITALDLQSNGAILLSEASPKQWALPQMKLSPEHYAEKHETSKSKNWISATASLPIPSHGYQSLHRTYKNPKSATPLDLILDKNSQARNIPEILSLSHNMEELERNYYRYLSAQSHHLSLDFYQKAAQYINTKTKDSDVRALFYCLIAVSTSGFKAGSQITNEKEVLESLRELWRLYNLISLPKGFILFKDEWWRYAITLSFLTNFTPMSPWPYTLQMMSIVQKATTLKWKDLTNHEAVGDRLKQIEKIVINISKVSETCGYAFYEGIKFVNIEVEEVAGEKYVEFSELATLILNGYDQKLSEPLIRLMSTFALDSEITDKLPNAHYSEDFSSMLSTSLSLLGHMQTNISPDSNTALTQDDLLLFITELERKHRAKKPGVDNDELAIQCVQDEYAAHFADDFFEKIRTPGLSTELENLITQGFETLKEQNLVTQLVLSFPDLKGKEHRKDVILNTTRICQQLQAPARQQFLSVLAKINNHRDNNLGELNDLLTAIGERGKTDDFICLVENAEQKANAVPQLVPKLTRYYQHVIPFLYGEKREHLTVADLQNLAMTLVLNSDEKDAAQFNLHFLEAMDLLKTAVDYCPNEKQGLLALLHAFSNASKEKPGYDLVSFTTYLKEASKFLTSADIIRSLTDHYLTAPLELYALLELIKNPDEWDQLALLSMITALLNNGLDCNIAVVREFLDLCTQQGGNPAPLFLLAKSFFTSPPYPTFEQLIGWHNECKDDLDYEGRMNSAYQQYNLAPCEREPENSFKRDEATRLAAGFQGMSFSEDELDLLEAETELVQSLQTDELKQSLQAISDLDEGERASQYPRLIALLAELLCRSKGQSGGHGLSYELNTVQYLAVFAFLKSNGHMTSEMATGEGKSRTMMMAIACQFAFNKTVDFVTSDMQLAQRDYLEYQAFFKILGAETRLISATSSPSVYQCKGIHFSDASNLSLFRNKARSQGKANLVIDPDPRLRALLLDEADRTYFDISETRFNFSDVPKDSAIKNMEWIYSFLIRFFTQSDAQKQKRCFDLYENDIDACTSAFKEFVTSQHDYNDDMLAQMAGVSNEQLEAWQVAAVTALNLQLGKDYALEPNVLIETSRGPKLATEARLIYGHRLSKNSKFSFGVHQCLHAYLNLELQNPTSATSLKCAELARAQLAADKPTPIVHPCFIHPEKQIVYSTTAKSFLDEYNKGDVWAITGTAGSVMEREEAALLFGKKTDTHQPMEFVTVPRKNDLQRQDCTPRLTGNFKQRVAALLEYIVEARAAGRPVLLICEDDTQAQVIRDALLTLAGSKPGSAQIPATSWQFVDSTTTSNEEKAVIAKAGQPGMVTISTSRLGRGSDIKLTPESKTAGGLRVLASYLPNERDQGQIFGRGGRYGDLGDARLVVDKQQLCRQLGKKKLEQNFFLANEFYMQSQQTQLDREKQMQRIIRNALSDFRIKITDAFFRYYDDLDQDAFDDNKKAIDDWAQFTKKADQLWNEVWPELDALIKKPTVNIVQVKAHLAKFQQSAQKEWDVLHENLGANADKLPKKLENLKLDPRTEHLLRLVLPKRRYTRADRTQVYKAYDKALDGRAVVYDTLFAESRAIWHGERQLFANLRAAWHGHGILFADTRALLAGKRPLFANLRAWMYKNRDDKKSMQQQCDTILDALQEPNSKKLAFFIRNQDVPEFLQPEHDDLLLSFRIQLVEAILDYAHTKLENNGKVAKKDMQHMRVLLLAIKETRGTQEDLVSSVKAGLKPVRGSFFSRSLKGDINKIIKQRLQEQAELEATLPQFGG